MDSYERVVKAINFDTPDRIPILNINKDQKDGDVLWYDLRVYDDSNQEKKGWHKGNKSEWGYVWRTLDDGTMGQPTEPVIYDFDNIEDYVFPEENEALRFAEIDPFLEMSEGYYRLAMLIATGFTTYTFIRGFENAMLDFGMRDPQALILLKKIFEFEKKLMKCCKNHGFHGFHLGDDWGTQHGMMISAEMWDEIFAPLYKDQIEYAHELGLHIWFHSCGNFQAIIDRMHDLKVDVINIAQPNVVDYQSVGNHLKGKQCFLMPLSYQTTSISGTRQEILGEAQKMYDALGTRKGGFIGYTEEYYCMGMSESNFEACKEAFARIKIE